MGRKGRRRRKLQRSEDDIMAEITQKSSDLADVQAELKAFKNMWSNCVVDDPVPTATPALPPPASNMHRYTTNTFNSNDAPKALNAIHGPLATNLYRPLP